MPLAPEIQELQALVRYLETLQDMRTQENNRLKSANPSTLVQTMLEDRVGGSSASIHQRVQAAGETTHALLEKRLA